MIDQETRVVAMAATTFQNPRRGPESVIKRASQKIEDQGRIALEWHRPATVSELVPENRTGR